MAGCDGFQGCLARTHDSLHRHPAFEPLVPPHRSFPIADFLSDTVLSRPMGPDVTEAYFVQQTQRAINDRSVFS